MSKSAEAKQRHQAKRERKRRANERRREERLHLEIWSQMCATCAYRPGTPASRDEGHPGLRRSRLELLNSEQPFYCHDVVPETWDGYRDMDDSNPLHKKLCVGHMRALDKIWRQRGKLPSPRRCCPHCQSEEMARVHHAASFALPECWVMECGACGYHGEPE